MANHINSNSKLRVLILDDDTDFRSLYTNWISDLEFSPVPISNLLEAQNILERDEVDIAIIDLFLDEKPDVAYPKGLLLIRNIIENKKNVQIIVITGDPRTTVIEWQEITEYIRKGIVAVMLAKNSENLKENFQNELIAIKNNIEQGSKYKINTADINQLRVSLCYSPDDNDSVDLLSQRLKSEQDIRVWAKEEILPGQDINYEIEAALGSSDAILICISSISMVKDGFVQKVIKIALDLAKEKIPGSIFIIPLKINKCETPHSLNYLQAVNLFEKDGYDQLLRALRHRARTLIR